MQRTMYFSWRLQNHFIISMMAMNSLQPKLISDEEARDYLHQLDLTYIADSMCASHYPLPRWQLADALHCAKLYKNFLLLQKKNASVPLVPTREIDEFWHNHILHTQQYFQDCARIFGYYLHHQPVSPRDNTEQLIADFTRTKELYFAEFNEPLTVQANRT